jgi:hypothetical protein
MAGKYHFRSDQFGEIALMSAPVHLALTSRARARRADLETYRGQAIALAVDPGAYQAMIEGRQAELPSAAIDRPLVRPSPRRNPGSSGNEPFSASFPASGRGRGS